MLTEFTPASCNGRASFASWVPLVETPRERTPGCLGYPPGDLDQVLANTRFAAREPKFTKSQVTGSGDHPNDFVGGEVICFLRPAFIALRHAIEAAFVAAIGYRNPEIVDYASKAVHWQ